MGQPAEVETVPEDEVAGTPAPQGFPAEDNLGVESEEE